MGLCVTSTCFVLFFLGSRSGSGSTRGDADGPGAGAGATFCLLESLHALGARGAFRAAACGLQPPGQPGRPAGLRGTDGKSSSTCATSCATYNLQPPATTSTAICCAAVLSNSALCDGFSAEMAAVVSLCALLTGFRAPAVATRPWPRGHPLRVEVEISERAWALGRNATDNELQQLGSVGCALCLQLSASLRVLCLLSSLHRE
jgi:hypothetical protein